jgi:regulator of sigma E protease
MIESPGMLMTIIAFLLVIGPLIFVHELGHYWAGRIFGVKADVFSIGFGREILGWTDRRGTRWKVAGDMNPASAPTPEWLSLPAEERNKTFQAKPLWQRFIIVAAGPVTNFILAILIFAGFFLAFGEPRTPPVIQAVMEQSAAAEAGLQPGDRITSVAGRPVERFEDVARIVGIRPGEELAIDLVRGGEAMTVTATQCSAAC